MKKLILLPVVAAAFLVSCKSTSTATAKSSTSDKVVGYSPSFTGKKQLTEGMIAEGKTLFENSCAKCHALPSPKSFTDEKWVGIMNAMAPKSKLSDKQSELVYDYVTFKN